MQLKRTLSILLVFCAVLTLLPFGAQAAKEIVGSGSCGENLLWTLGDDNVLTISGTGKMEDYSPFEDEPIRAPWDSLSHWIGLVVIEPGVESIGDFAFYSASGIQEVRIPDSVTTIGKYAFRDCYALKKINIPKRVTKIEEFTFFGCDSLQELTIPGTVKQIGDYAFSDCHHLRKLTIENGVTTLGKGAFYYCDRLETLVLPESVQTVGEIAFEWCGGLKNVVLPKSVTTVEARAFEGCEKLTDVYYAGSEAEWNQISVASSNDPLLNATIHYENTRGPLAFQDVRKGSFYYDSVIWAVEHEPQITQGTSETRFSPDNTCTRGQVVTFLWRAAGEPNPTGSRNPFRDVQPDDYWYKAVLWAVEKKITVGTSDTAFSPNAPCTRAHVVTFLWRAQGSEKAGTDNPFKDVAPGQYYTDAVLWAVNHEPQITNGTAPDRFSPANPCTRAQIVTFLYRCMGQAS